jgi:membrane-associated phospholipid phosphatase
MLHRVFICSLSALPTQAFDDSYGVAAWSKLRSPVGEVLDAHPSDTDTMAQMASYFNFTPGVGTTCHGVWTNEFHQQALAQKEAQGDKQLWWEYSNLTMLLAPMPSLQHYIFDLHRCPYGRKLPGDVTWPDPPADLHQHVRHLDPICVIAVFYSYMPFFVAGCVIVKFIYGRGTKELWFLLFLGCSVFATEVVLKKQCNQPRPGTLMQVRDYNGRFVGSCVETCGMPSGHAAMATGWFTLFFLDAAFRIGRPSLDSTWAVQMDEDEGLSLTGVTRKYRKCLIYICKSLILVPWVDMEILSHTKFVVYTITWCSLMLPVPFMRVVLYDHSISQVSWGMFVGFTLALVLWRLARCLQHRYSDWEGKEIFKCGRVLLLWHNYNLPTNERARLHESSRDIIATEQDVRQSWGAEGFSIQPVNR